MTDRVVLIGDFTLQLGPVYSHGTEWYPPGLCFGQEPGGKTLCTWGFTGGDPDPGFEKFHVVATADEGALFFKQGGPLKNYSGAFGQRN